MLNGHPARINKTKKEVEVMLQVCSNLRQRKTGGSETSILDFQPLVSMLKRVS